MSGSVLFIQRIGIIRNPDPIRNVCDIEFADRGDGETIETGVPLYHPYSAGSVGIYGCPQSGTLCLVGRGYMNQAVILSLLNDPISISYAQQAGAGLLSVDYVPPPSLEEGEYVLKGAGTTYTKYNKSGDIVSAFGQSKQQLDSDNIYSLSSVQNYTATSAHLSISGDIKRELAGKRKSISSQDKLTDADFDDELITIGRSSLFPVASIGGNMGTAQTPVFRNPPLTESKDIYYEYNKQYNLRPPYLELDIYQAGPTTSTDPNNIDFTQSRAASRSDAFDLGPSNFNSLAEKIIGTGVDINGNLLDINRKIIPLDSKDSLTDQMEKLRKSIKFHFEINARKENLQISNSDMSGTFSESENSTAANHARWFVDVDGEGLTKLNIPATSSKGNVPLHLRYLPGSSFDFSYDQDQPDTEDIKHIYYGSSDGVELSGNIIPFATNTKELIKWSMPYHDISFSDILDSSVLMTNNRGIDTGGNSLPTLRGKSKLSTKIGDNILSANYLSNSGQNAAAGGRSLWVNLDGSFEFAVGYDQIDKKSITLDTAGSVIGRIGADKLNRSIAVATDGEINLISGAGEKKKSGGFKLIIQSEDGSASTVEVTDGHIYLRSGPGKNIVIESGNNLILDARANVIINGEGIGQFGKHSEDGSVVAPEFKIPRKGNVS